MKSLEGNDREDGYGKMKMFNCNENGQSTCLIKMKILLLCHSLFNHVIVNFQSPGQ